MYESSRKGLAMHGTRHAVVVTHTRLRESGTVVEEAVEQLLGRGKHHVKLLLPYAVGGMVAALHDTAQVLSSSYTENGIELDAIVDETLFGRLRQYVTEEV